MVIFLFLQQGKSIHYLLLKNLISPSHIGILRTSMNYVKSIPWYIYKMFDDTNGIAATWSSLFLDIAGKHLPLKQHRVKRQQQPKLLTGEIIDAIRTRERYKYTNDNEQYKFWRNKIWYMIKQSKKLQYSTILNENCKNPASV